ncbi:hypothetical protein [Methylocystis heyeri]|uniref:Uncharacterized protein n=1 Tax=Methylocystis heyeri TaxID=391905 RepID=A0A6B8KEA1_9HYPH|nr:hypothetical protein [Methylocystis heyeri]QGM46596.1 hypothetical protein H2LOC_013315 [Methylocystis heyeri]
MFFEATTRGADANKGVSRSFGARLRALWSRDGAKSDAHPAKQNPGGAGAGEKAVLLAQLRAAEQECIFAREEIKSAREELMRINALLEQEKATSKSYLDHIAELEGQITRLAADMTEARNLIHAQRLELNALARLRQPLLRRPLKALRRALLEIGRKPVPVFDERYYLEHNPDVRVLAASAYMHYLKHGFREGRNPNAMFDSAWYLEMNEDVREADINPLVHYYLHGAWEGRDPHPLFSTSWYLDQHPELKDKKLNPLEHYLKTLRS